MDEINKGKENCVAKFSTLSIRVDGFISIIEELIVEPCSNLEVTEWEVSSITKEDASKLIECLKKIVESELPNFNQAKINEAIKIIEKMLVFELPCFKINFANNHLDIPYNTDVDTRNSIKKAINDLHISTRITRLLIYEPTSSPQ